MFKTLSFGEMIRKLREEKALPLRTVAAYLDIDQAILSKIERGQRAARREQVISIAAFFGVKENELLVAWLSDKLICEVADEEIALKALQVAEQKIEYRSPMKVDRKMLSQIIKEELKQFTKIKKAWIFGSFSREEDNQMSDVDIAIETDPGFSYFDLAEVQYKLEKTIKRKVDVGFLDAFKPHILDHIRPDLKLLYERQ